MSRAAKPVRSGRWNRKINRAVVEAMEVRRLFSTPSSVTVNTGTLLTLNQNGDVTVSGSITTADGHDVYQFNPDIGGSTTFTVVGASIDSQLRIYNSAGVAVTAEIDAGWDVGLAETTTYTVTSGNYFYVAVGAYSTDYGSYTLTINGTSMSSTVIATPSPAYSGTSSGNSINWAGDTDYYTFTAPAQTDHLNLTITPGSGLDTYSVLYSSSGAQLTTIDDGATATADTLANFAITAGNTYYLAVRSYWRSTASGTYGVAVDFSPNAGDPPPTVAPDSGMWLRLNPFGDTSISASIGAVDEYDVYAFLLDNSGSTTFTVSGALDAQFRVYDSSGNPLIATVDSAVGGINETATLSLGAATWYYVAVGGWSTSTGAYSLSINGPSAYTSALSVAGPFWAGSSSDSVDYDGDVDYQSVVAPAGTTSMYVEVVPSSGMDSYVQVYNSAGSLIYTFDNGFTGGTDSGTATVTAGSTYYIATSSYYRDQTGTCSISVDFDPDANAGDPPATVAPGSGTWAWANPFGDFTKTGAISGNTEVDTYAFVADMSGNQVITLSCAGTLDGQLRVYNSSGNPVTATIDSSGSGGTESYTLSATAGSWYYIAVAGWGWTQGNYTLGVNGPSFTTSTLTPAEPTWTASAPGSLAYGGDFNYVRFVAPAGVTTLNLSVTPVATLDTYVELYDGTGAYLQTISSGSTGVTDTANGIAVTAGATYYLGVSGGGRGSIGGYTVAIDFNPDLDYGNLPATITPSIGYWDWQNQLGDLVRYNSIATGNGVDITAFMPQIGGSFTISTTGALDAQLRVYGQNGTAITDVIDSYWGGQTETTTVTLTAWQWYYVGVAGYQVDTGAYTLTIDGPSISTANIATNVPDYTAWTSDIVDQGGDVDYFSFTAPAGTTTFIITITPAAGFNSYGMVFDSSGARLNNVGSGGTGVADTLTMSVTAGQTYTVAVGGATTTASGNYTIAGNFGPDAAPVPVTISGTTGNDTISLTQSAGVLTVTKNGVVTTYVAANISTLAINGLEGNDVITVGAGVQACTIDGGYGNDSLTGGDGSDFIRGDNGLDTIRGGAGNDTIMGNLDNDQLYGDLGNDQIQAGLGYDLLYAGGGNDSLYGGDQSDTIYGEDGNDYIEGKGKADTVDGGAGNDTIYGNAGNDSILGGAGDDWLYGEDNPTVFLDTVDGGAGMDRYTADPNDILTSCELILA